MSIWDDPSMSASGDYVKFDNVGDNVTGTITHLGRKVWDDGSVSPQLELDTDDGTKTLTAGQVRLRAALAEQRPEIGDRISITLSQIEKRGGGKTLKHFEVKVARGVTAGTQKAAASTDAPF